MKNLKIDKYLVTRNNIKSLFELINNINDFEIVLDFKNVSFMSRSCADEYIKLKNNSNKNIKEENVNKDVDTILNLVEKQQKIEKYECSSMISFPTLL